MQISPVQFAPARFTTDRADEQQKSQQTAEGPDRTRQTQTRELTAAAKIVNESGQLGPDRELTIALHRDTGQPVVRIIDRQTHEIIRQIPNERVLRLAEEFKREAAAEAPHPGGYDWHSTLA